MARGRQQGRRPDYTWIGTTFFENALAIANVIFPVASYNTAGTIVRVRGSWVAGLDGPAANDKLVIGLGLMVADDDQVTAGATAFPSPIEDTDADWLWYSYIALIAQTVTQDESYGGQVDRGIIDSKAMRRVKQNSQLVMVMDGIRQGGTPTADVSGGVRSLLST